MSQLGQKEVQFVMDVKAVKLFKIITGSAVLLPSIKAIGESKVSAFDLSCAVEIDDGKGTKQLILPGQVQTQTLL